MNKKLLIIFNWLLLFVIAVFLLFGCYYLIGNINANDQFIIEHNTQLLSSQLESQSDSSSQDATTAAHYKAIEIGVTVGVLGIIIIVLLIIYFIKKKRGTL